MEVMAVYSTAFIKHKCKMISLSGESGGDLHTGLTPFLGLGRVKHGRGNSNEKYFTGHNYTIRFPDFQEFHFLQFSVLIRLTDFSQYFLIQLLNRQTSACTSSCSVNQILLRAVQINAVQHSQIQFV
jgi:hypothetical protein